MFLSQSTLCTWSGIGICGAFVAWFVLSVVAQVRGDIDDRVPVLSPLGLIPRWAFFAPRPAMDDTYLMYRDRDASGAVGNLICLTTPRTRRWFHSVWNPGKFHSKVVDDIVSNLVRQKQNLAKRQASDRVLMLTVPYIVILHFVMRMPHSETAVARQFVIVHNRPYSDDRSPAVDFISEFHALPEVVGSCI